MSQREESIRKAIQDLDENSNLSLKLVAAAYGIPRTTLRDRLAGGTSQRISQQQTQRLSPEQENFLADWILDQGAQGFPPSHARARDMACRILSANGDFVPLGKDWIPKFLKRNTQVSSVIGRRIEASSVSGASRPALEAFYELFRDVKTRYNIQTDDIWNMDVQGLGLRVCSNTMVLASSKRKRVYVKSPENREWVSVLEAISATGKIAKPLIIFKGKSPQLSWFESDIPDWAFTTSENGWTSNEMALGWLSSIFLPQTKPDMDRPRLLLLDGHGSHTTVDFMWECKKNNVHLVFLPPHTSHVLQPLDLGVFSPLMACYRQIIADLSRLDDAAFVKKQRFIFAYNKARIEALSPRVLHSGWNAAGLVPWNPTKGLNSSQVLQPQKTTQERPCSPSESILRSGKSRTSLSTPMGNKETKEAIRSLKKRKATDEDWIGLVEKTSKALALAIAHRARDLQKTQELEHINRQLSTKSTRKRVLVDPNTRFASIKQIKHAEAEQRARDELIASRGKEKRG